MSHSSRDYVGMSEAKYRVIHRYAFSQFLRQRTSSVHCNNVGKGTKKLTSRDDRAAYSLRRIQLESCPWVLRTSFVSASERTDLKTFSETHAFRSRSVDSPAGALPGVDPSLKSRQRVSRKTAVCACTYSWRFGRLIDAMGTNQKGIIHNVKTGEYLKQAPCAARM